MPPFENPLVSIASFFGAGFLSCLLAWGFTSLRSRYYAKRGWNTVQMSVPFFVLGFGIPTALLARVSVGYFEDKDFPTIGYVALLLGFTLIIAAAWRSMTIITWSADTIVLRRLFFRTVAIATSDVVSVVERDRHIRISSKTDDIYYNLGYVGAWELFRKLETPVEKPVYSLAAA